MDVKQGQGSVNDIFKVIHGLQDEDNGLFYVSESIKVRYHFFSLYNFFIATNISLSHSHGLSVYKESRKRSDVTL